MALTLIAYIFSNIAALAAQQFSFMQIIRDPVPYRRVVIAGSFAALFFALTVALGLFYYSTYYSTFEKDDVLSGTQPWAHSVLVETKGVLLALAFLSSLIFLFLAKKVTPSHGTGSKRVAILSALLPLALGALNLATEMLIGSAAT